MENDTLRVSVLGAVRAWLDCTELALGRPTQRAVLGMLAMHAGRAVSRDRLIDGIWGEDPPQSAANGVHVYVAELRRLLEPGRPARSAGKVLVTSGHGYLLRIDAARVDATLFARLLREAKQARETRDVDQAIRAFDAALELWHGTPWAGVPGPYAEVERIRLGELYAAGIEDRADALLAAGRLAEVIADLPAAIREYPLRERLSSLMMLALFRTDRQAEAYAVYESVRKLLAAELGVEPSRELRQLHAMMLSGDQALDVPGPGQSKRRAAAGSALRHFTPRQLPPAVRIFVGRQTELVSLTDLARQASDPGRRAVVVAVIDGTPGVGKTTLAVHFAHHVATAFSDGQLYANLRGFDPASQPASARETLRALLCALAVDPAQIPADTDAMVGLYRSVLAERQVLLVLDNARSETQVRPLLPGSGGSLVVVTSRRRLTGLLADGASLLTLETMSATESRALLTRRLASYRLPADVESADEVARLCARLPLALTVVAARAAGSSRRPLASIAAELRTARNRLNALDSGESATSVRSVLSWSYTSLSPAGARMFRLLGVHPGPDISVPAAASLAAVTTGRARAAIAELQRAHLLTDHVPSRYSFHDLLRAYARERARVDEPEPARTAAVGRALEHYLHSACAAALALNSARVPITLPQPGAGVRPESCTGPEQATAWFEAEHAVLIAAARQAAETGHDPHTWQFAWALTEYLDRSGFWDEWAELWQAGVRAAQRTGDRSVNARAAQSLARAYIRLSRYEDARVHLQQSLDMYATVHDPVGHAQAYLNLAWLCDRLGNLPQALQNARAARELYRIIGDEHGEANCLNAIGWYCCQTGDADAALAACQQAVALLRKLDDRFGEAMAWDSLGYAHHRLDQRDQAATCYEHALRIRERIGDRYNIAATLIRLGDTHQATGLEGQARDAWQRALAILEDLRHQDAEQVRAKLDRLAT